MRIQFRVSDFGQVAKANVVRATSKRGLCEIDCGDGARVIWLFPRVMQQLGFWTQKKTLSQRRLLLMSGAAPSRPWTQASKPALTNSSLAEETRRGASPFTNAHKLSAVRHTLLLEFQ